MAHAEDFSPSVSRRREGCRPWAFLWHLILSTFQDGRGSRFEDLITGGHRHLSVARVDIAASIHLMDQGASSHHLSPNASRHQVQDVSRSGKSQGHNQVVDHASRRHHWMTAYTLQGGTTLRTSATVAFPTDDGTETPATVHNGVDIGGVDGSFLQVLDTIAYLGELIGRSMPPNGSTTACSCFKLDDIITKNG